MRPLRLAALASLLAGLALLGYAVVEGEARVGLFLIFPYLVGTGGKAALGMLLLFGAAVMWAHSATRGTAPPAGELLGGDAPPGEARVERRSGSGGVVLLGPIPIVWGSDRRILPWMVAAGAALLLLGLLLTFR